MSGDPHDPFSSRLQRGWNRRLLDDRQQRFVDACLCEPNATRAAIKAGYSPRTARSQGHDLLKEPEIADALRKARAKLSHDAEVDRKRVIEELGRIAFGGLSAFVEVDENGRPRVTLEKAAPEDLDALMSLSWEETSDGVRIALRRADKLQALNLPAKIFGLFDPKKTPEEPDALTQLLNQIRARGSTAEITPGRGPGGIEEPWNSRGRRGAAAPGRRVEEETTEGRNPSARSSLASRPRPRILSKPVGR